MRIFNQRKTVPNGLLISHSFWNGVFLSLNLYFGRELNSQNREWVVSLFLSLWVDFYRLCERGRKFRGWRGQFYRARPSKTTTVPLKNSSFSLFLLILFFARPKSHWWRRFHHCHCHHRRRGCRSAAPIVFVNRRRERHAPLGYRL